jgi:hypothetical protein
MTVSASRAKCYAGASPLERPVRQHCSRRTKPMRQSEGPRHWFAPRAADAPALRVGARAIHSAATANGERRRRPPSGGGTTDWLKFRSERQGTVAAKRRRLSKRGRCADLGT